MKFVWFIYYAVHITLQYSERFVRLRRDFVVELRCHLLELR
jgi:hypothetical protein